MQTGNYAGKQGIVYFREWMRMELMERLHWVETRMLEQFDRICAKHDISYFAYFGTALGAVRHDGFIPWDEDVDIGMLREDYEKLRQIPKEEWGELILIDAWDECTYHEKIFPRIYLPGTVLELEEWLKYIKAPGTEAQPVWIDIFLFDRADSKEQAFRTAKKAKFLNMLYYYTKYRINIAPDDPLSRKLRSLVKQIGHFVLHLSHNRLYYLKKYLKTVTASKGEYLICYDSWSMNDIMGSFATEEMLLPARRKTFEDTTICIPAQVEQILTNIYGDYMTPPPESERVSQIPINLYLGDFFR